MITRRDTMCRWSQDGLLVVSSLWDGVHPFPGCSGSPGVGSSQYASLSIMPDTMQMHHSTNYNISLEAMVATFWSYNLEYKVGKVDTVQNEFVH